MPNKTVTCVDGDGATFEVTADELRWRPSAYAIVIKDGAVLLSPQYNGYDLPGGGIELGETLEDAILREVKEETGITVSNPRIFHCESNLYKLKSSDKGLFVHSILLYYVCDYVSGELSTAGFTEEDKKYSQFPEWRQLTDGKLTLQRNQVASSYDWRPLLEKVV